MQLGFNTNFRHRDVVFHVQTEDSGRANPHVITHLFHGGNIIASVKSDYTDLLSEADLEGAVRRLMESQHKAMLKQLSRGEHDRAIRERLGAAIFAGDSSSSATDQTPGLGRRASTPSPGPASEPAARSASASVSTSANGSASAATGASASRPVAAGRATAERTAVTPDKRDSSSGLARVFGERVVSEKPLDEVVLEYLVENARKRKRQPKP
ncbi:MAG: hypothetical protein IPK00_16705 [Deltaproteobacteria bacterium]|nr:hypothetical protein [Deltaproteobacteria bacterium]